MNIDALIEDLEAQGYFATKSETTSEVTERVCKQVLVIRERFEDVPLAMPLLGKSFIAGFVNKNSKSTWLVIQSYEHIEPQDASTSLQQIDVTLKELICLHLIGVGVKICITEIEHTGYIIRVTGKILEFVSYESKTLWIPLAQVRYMVVEKFSIESKVWPT